MGIIRILTLTILCSLFIGCADNHNCNSNKDFNAAELKVVQLLRDSIQLNGNQEIVVQHLELPASSVIPKHYHPGEEIVYLIHGSGELSIEGDETRIISKGEIVNIPKEKIHSFKTTNQSVEAIIFRVHEKGQPERITVD